MTNTCSVDGCPNHPARYSRLCSKHKRTKQRWGHPLQIPVARAEIKTATLNCQRLIATSANADGVWASLCGLLEGLQLTAIGTLAERKSNIVLVEPAAAAAAQTILEVLADAKGEEVILNMIAIGYLAAKDSGRFLDDRALFASASRRFRALGRSQFRQYIDPTASKRRVVMKDPNSTETQHLGHQLVSVFGPAGTRIQQKEQEKMDDQNERKQAVLVAITGQVNS